MSRKDRPAPGGPGPAKIVPAKIVPAKIVPAKIVPAKIIPGGRVKALLDGMAERHAGLMAAGEPPGDLPVTVNMDRERFRAEFQVVGVDPDNVTLRVEDDQLVVTIGIGGGVERIDEGSRVVEASARIWERSFKLPFKPSLAATRATVAPELVTIDSVRPR